MTLTPSTTPTTTCPTCYGYGRIEAYSQPLGTAGAVSSFPQIVECPKCGGCGKVAPPPKEPNHVAI